MGLILKLILPLYKIIANKEASESDSSITFYIILSRCVFLQKHSQWNRKESPEINFAPIDTLSLTKEARICNGEKTVSVTSGAGKTGQPLVKE